jgi:hypothetical protein
MRKQFKTLSALMLSAVLAVSALPFSKVEAKSKWVEINGVNYEINRISASGNDRLVQKHEHLLR